MTRSLMIKTLFFLLVTMMVVNYGYAQNTISGTVRYSDDNSLVTSGTVNAYTLNGVFIANANINSNGTYSVIGLPGTEYDMIGIPSIGQEEEDNFVPTGYPSAIDPAQMQAVQAAGTVINIDVYVIRSTKGPTNRYTSSISGFVKNDKQSVKDAVVYVMSGSSVYGFGITNADGSYIINNIPLGDYILVAHRIGENSDSKQITLTNSGSDNVNFNLTPVTNMKNNNTNPVQFNLSQNYPNPFNPSTVISYVVPKDGNVSLKVYNSLGELVTSLINADQKAGGYSVRFDGTNLSSGIYFYSIETAGFKDTKRMVLVK